MKARVFVSLKPSVLDPQGQAIKAALNAHGHPVVAELRQGKFFDVVLREEEGRAQGDGSDEVEAIARDVLANPVTEDFRIEWEHD